MCAGGTFTVGGARTFMICPSSLQIQGQLPSCMQKLSLYASQKLPSMFSGIQAKQVSVLVSVTGSIVSRSWMKKGFGMAFGFIHHAAPVLGQYKLGAESLARSGIDHF